MPSPRRIGNRTRASILSDKVWSRIREPPTPKSGFSIRAPYLWQIHLGLFPTIKLIHDCQLYEIVCGHILLPQLLKSRQPCQKLFLSILVISHILGHCSSQKASLNSLARELLRMTPLHCLDEDKNAAIEAAWSIRLVSSKVEPPKMAYERPLSFAWKPLALRLLKPSRHLAFWTTSTIAGLKTHPSALATNLVPRSCRFQKVLPQVFLGLVLQCHLLCCRDHLQME